MEDILCRERQVLRIPAAESKSKQGRPSDIVDGVLHGNLPWHDSARLVRGNFDVGYEEDGAEFFIDRARNRDETVTLPYNYLATPEQGGSDVVGVALYGVGKAEQLFQGKRLAQEQIGGDHASGDGGGAAAEASAEGNLVVAGDRQGRGRLVLGLVDRGYAPVDHIIGARAQLSGAVSGDLDGELVSPFYGDGVEDFQGHAQGVEARAHVGCRGRGPDRYLV